MDRSDDPLACAMGPPVDESPQQRIRRIREEQEALRLSDEIDRELNRERAESKKHRPAIRVLLLGPSGSGKSTMLKNFQLAFTPKALQAQAAKYTVLVFLNVVSTVRLLCDMLHEQRAVAWELGDLRERCARLQPVADLEESLKNWFNDGGHFPFSSPPSSPPPAATRAQERNRKTYEVTVNAGNLWRSMHSSLRRMVSIDDISKIRGREHVRRVLQEHMKDIEAMAQHPAMNAMLASRSQRLEHTPGYFLNDLERITAPNYTPTDDDILRTRLRTLGVSETRFKIESGPERGRTWVLVDVSGSRYQRAAWVPYFDDVNAIIFMAPIGEFDQFLMEDRSVNCLRDSYELWESIVTNRLLAKVEIILFLNKFDMLSQKLNDGVPFSKYVTSYKDRNTVECVGRYIQRKFAALHRQRSANPTRMVHCHFTSATDKSTTVALITSLRVTTLRANLNQSNFL